MNKKVDRFSQDALDMLRRYTWPGNLRELENIIERSVALATDEVVQLDDIPLDLALGPGRIAWDERLSFREARDHFERQLILRAIDRAGGNQTVAARLLGMHRNTLLARMAQIGLRPGDGSARAAADA